MTEVVTLQADHCFCHIWEAANNIRISRHPGLCKGLAIVVPQPKCSHHPATRHPHFVRVQQASCASGAVTVTGEHQLKETFERKLFKYAGLVSKCQQAGWRLRCLPVVGCSGFAAHEGQSFQHFGADGCGAKEESHRVISS